MVFILNAYLRLAIIDLIFIDLVLVSEVVHDAASGGFNNPELLAAPRIQTDDFIMRLIQLVFFCPTPSVHPASGIVQQCRRLVVYGR